MEETLKQKDVLAKKVADLAKKYNVDALYFNLTDKINQNTGNFKQGSGSKQVKVYRIDFNDEYPVKCCLEEDFNDCINNLNTEKSQSLYLNGMCIERLEAVKEQLEQRGI